MGKKPRRTTRNDHRRSRADSDRAASRERRVLPPTPMYLLTRPKPDALAHDGSVTLQMFTDDDPHRWTVFNADGRMQELLAFTRGEMLTDEGLAFLDIFECRRAQLGDPHFCDYDPGAREREAASAPRGPAEVLSITYHHDEPSPDGSRSVLVCAQGELDAWLVLDADGRLLDGVHFPDATDAHGDGGERFVAFLMRRDAARDPRVTAFADVADGS